jgi:Tol biopolymer transport system component
MGEVYRARDSRLKRQVALKVLPTSFASDEDRLARFRREAEVLATLNHPHIAQIYGLEKNHEGTALVMELVEGEDLSERIARGAIPLDEALPIARQIAEALEAAHEQGIIHRDLKPANIKVRADGTVKVLDFGLAKALESNTPSAASGGSISPTITSPAQMTGIGVILGTAAYMSPEQARGRVVDKRADIWAFGCVVFEMLTGTRAFSGEDVSETLAAVIKSDADWAAMPPEVPRRMVALLNDCLVRDPKQRLRDIGDARRLLEQIMAGVADAATAVASSPSHTPPLVSRALPWAVAVVALTAATALAIVHFRETPRPRQSARFQVHAPESAPINGFMLSPDGRYIAFSTGGGFGMQTAGTKLWLRRIDSLEMHNVTGSEEIGAFADQFFWSPDSEFIAFVTQDGKLKRISVQGGPAQTLASGLSQVTRGVWGHDGFILILPGLGAPIQRVPDSGGAPVDITVRLQAMLSAPNLLPDGRHLLYSVFGMRVEANGIHVVSLEDGVKPTRLLADGTAAKYVRSEVPGPRGYVLFVRDTTLMVQPFDVDTLTLTGQRLPVAEPVGRFSVSQNGTLAHMAGGPPSVRQELLWVDRSGKPLAVAAPASDYRNLKLSPDEKSIVFDRNDQTNSDVWILDLVRGVPSRVTFDTAADNLAIWSFDGRRILWPSRRGGSFDLYTKAASGAGNDEKLVTMGTPTGWGSDWSRDGQFVLFQRPGENTGQDLWIAPQGANASTESKKPFAYLATPFNEGNGVFSSDGRWIAYESDESGRPEVYVQSFPLTNQKVRISSGGGSDAAWSTAGELFYLAADRSLMAVPYRATATTFEPGASKALFPIPGNIVRRSYAVSADGRRFLIGKPVSEDRSEPITVVLNWIDELKPRLLSK